ncbi:MAG: hypothetical protein ACTSRS_21525 [Candidatus Helarchaeota archaeon]
MANITYINSTDLDKWADSISSRSELPTLIRDLIFSTMDKGAIQKIDFPSGDDSQKPGFDGYLRTSEDNQFVPKGESVWELSCSKGVNKKANRDYSKRTEENSEEFRMKTIYVFATLRKWDKKDDWVKEKIIEDQWKSIKVVDGGDIENWLQIAKPIHLKYSIKIGKHPEGVVNIEDYVKDWENLFEKEVPIDLFLVSRDDEIVNFKEWLFKGDCPLSIRAETVKEAELFSVSALRRIDKTKEHDIFQRSFYVTEDQTLLELSEFKEELILICSGVSSEAISRADRNGHRVILPVSCNHRINLSQQHIELPKLPFDDTSMRLREAGFEEKQSRDLAILLRRSYPAFLRNLSKIPEDKPSWANLENSDILLPLIFVQQLEEYNEKDRELIEELTKKSFSEVISQLTRLKGEEDSPVQNIGDIWYLTSKYDCWHEFEEYFTSEKRQYFLEKALNIFSKYDKKFDLPLENRWASALYINEKTASIGIYKGMADTLCMMRTFFKEHERINETQEIKTIIDQILEAAIQDWRLWATLDPILPILAETSPDSFLSILDTGLKKHKIVFDKLFLEWKNPLFGGSYHNGILWGIERLAWFPEHLSFTTILLGKIIRFYGDLKLSNQPLESLHNIFFPMLPQTTANEEVRLAAIDLLRQRYSDIAWKLMINLLPKYQGFIKLNVKPKWSKLELHQNHTYEDISGFMELIYVRLIEDARNENSRWVDLIGSITTLPISIQAQVINELNQLDVRQINSIERKEILSAIRGCISTQNSYPDFPGKLSSDKVEALLNIYEQFQPNDLVERYYWLFGKNVHLLEGITKDWRQNERRIKEKQIAALKEIAEVEGVDGIIRFGNEIERAYLAGYFLNEIELFSELDLFPMIHYLESDKYSLVELSNGFLRSKLITDDAWGKKVLEKYRQDWSESLISKFLLCFPPNGETWKLLNEFDEDILSAYWSEIEVSRMRNFTQNDFMKAIDNLTKCDRPYSSGILIIENLELITENNLIIVDEVLSHCLNISPEKDSTYYSFKDLLIKLCSILYEQRYLEERLLFFEWNLLPLSEIDIFVPRTLHKHLNERPEYFVELVCNAYKSKSGSARELSEEFQYIAKHSHMLIESYRGIPKRSEQYDSEYVKEWVDKTRQGLAENDRVEVGEILLGQMLSGSPVDKDGCWPHGSIRELLDQYSTDELDRGFLIGVINSRGGTSRSTTEGGAQEKEIVNKFTEYRGCLVSQWPRLATIIDKIIEHYQSEAVSHDLRAELRKDLVAYF